MHDQTWLDKALVSTELTVILPISHFICFLSDDLQTDWHFQHMWLSTSFLLWNACSQAGVNVMSWQITTTTKRFMVTSMNIMHSLERMLCSFSVGKDVHFQERLLYTNREDSAFFSLEKGKSKEKISLHARSVLLLGKAIDLTHYNMLEFSCSVWIWEAVIQAGTCLRRNSCSYHISDQKYNTIRLLKLQSIFQWIV